MGFWRVGLVVARLLGAALAFACCTQPFAIAGTAKRIVSLNLCIDQLLIDLVDKDRIQALSHLAADPALSAVADRARGLRLVRGAAEEVLALQPDLVIAGEHSTPATVSLLRRLGLDVLVVPMATDFPSIRQAIRMIAENVGEPERGEEVIAAFDRRLAEAHPRDRARPTALAYQVNSLTAGAGSLIDVALEAAGYHNLARGMALGPGGRLPLEMLVTHPPDLLVLAHSPEAFATVSADNLRHPALRDLMRRQAHVAIEMPLWLCGTPHIVEAVERLERARSAIAVGKVVP